MLPISFILLFALTISWYQSFLFAFQALPETTTISFGLRHTFRKVPSSTRIIKLNMSSVRAEVDRLIAENPVMIFSKSYCPYCTRAKQAISEQGVSYKAIELDNIPDGEKIQAELLNKTGQRTVPNIFVKGTHVGGCDKTLEAIGNGNFRKLLNA